MSPTPTSTTQPRLGFSLYFLGIQPRVVLQAHHTNLLFFQDHNEPLHVWFCKITTQTCCFQGSQRTTLNPWLRTYLSQGRVWVYQPTNQEQPLRWADETRYSQIQEFKRIMNKRFEVHPFRRNLRRRALIRWRLFALICMSTELQSSWSEALWM